MIKTTIIINYELQAMKHPYIGVSRMGADELGNFWEEYCVVYCSLFYFSVEKGDYTFHLG